MVNKFSQWLVYVSITLLFYGLWAFFPKIASFHLKPKEVLIFQTIGVIIVASTVFFSLKEKITFSFWGIFFSILAGASGLIGTLFFLKSLQIGKTSVVVTMSALYPLITIFLAAIFLKETISLKNLVGIFFALCAMYLLSN